MDEDYRKISSWTPTPLRRPSLSFLYGSGYLTQNTQYQEAMTAIQNWKPDLVILNILLQSFNRWIS